MTPNDAGRLLKSEIVQEVGCTEPAAIAYALRTLVRQLPFPPTPDSLALTRLYISQDAFRNASTAVVPHLKQPGILAATADDARRDLCAGPRPRSETESPFA